MLLTRSPLVYPRRGLTARLACVKHAASVRPEPGSNSPLKSICQPRQNRRKQTTSSDPLNQKQNHTTGLSSVITSKESTHRQTTTHTPRSKTQGQETVQRLWTGLMHLSALTFGTLLSSQESDAHRASHSRSKPRGNPPNFTVSVRAGQIGSFRPSLPTRLSARNPPRRASALETFREFVGEPAAFASRFAPTRRTLLTFAVQMQIGIPDPRPSLPASALGTGRPASREAVLVPLVTPLARVSASDTSMMPHPHKSFLWDDLGNDKVGAGSAPTCHALHRPADASRRVAARSG